MVTYSHSRISSFENCPYQYKLRYIDRIKPEISNTIEAFMGSLVHEALEKLFKELKFQKMNSKKDLLKYYSDSWDKQYSEDILIVKANQGLASENYKKMGEKFISDYYEKYKPFDQLTILGLETTDRMTLPDGNQWHVRIDKFACDNEGNYFVIDYKTNSRMKDQEEADKDRQLALYSIWVKDKFKDAKSVKLVWNMLAFNKEVVSERTDEQLKKLQQEVCNKIKEIESATEFPTHVTALCNYCGYKSICPSFKHEVEIEAKESVKEFKEDDGVRLVDEFSELKMEIGKLRKKEEKVKDDLIEFAKQKGVDVVYGSNMKTSVREYDKIVMPEDREKLEKLLKDKGLWEEFVALSYAKLNKKVVSGEIDEDIKGAVKMGKGFRLSSSKRKNAGNE